MTERSNWEAVSALQRSVDPAVALLVARLQRRLSLEALANVRPIRPESPPPLFPPRRRLLDDALAERLRRVERAREVIDIVDEVTVETLCVVHGVVADRGIAEPGRLRTGSVGFEAGNPFGGAAAAELRSFVGQTLDELDRSRVDGWVGPAARVVARLLTIHPFNDGNGRVARFVFDLEQRRSAPTALGPGVDLWAPWRREYLDALRACDPAGPVDRFDAGDPAPFVRWVLDRSREGADLWTARTRAVARLHQRLVDALHGDTASGTAADAAVAIAVAIDRNVSLPELDDLDDTHIPDHPAGRPGAPSTVTSSVNALAADGLLVWDTRGLLQPSDRLLTVVGWNG